MGKLGNYGEGVAIEIERFAAILACVAYESREMRMELIILRLREGVTAMGDWRITVECINLPGHDC